MLLTFVLMILYLTKQKTFVRTSCDFKMREYKLKKQLPISLPSRWRETISYIIRHHSNFQEKSSLLRNLSENEWQYNILCKNISRVSSLKYNFFRWILSYNRLHLLHKEPSRSRGCFRTTIRWRHRWTSGTIVFVSIWSFFFSVRF